VKDGIVGKSKSEYLNKSIRNMNKSSSKSPRILDNSTKLDGDPTQTFKVRDVSKLNLERDRVEEIRDKEKKTNEEVNIGESLRSFF